MNAISKALDEIKFTIPRPILEAVFIRRELNWRNTPINIDEQILLEVIRPRVLVDCDLIGGAEVIISLIGLLPEQVNQYTQVFKIPKDRTGGRSILSVLNVTFADPNAGNTLNLGAGTACDASALLQTAQGLLSSSLPLPNISTADAQLIGENVVMIRGSTLLPTNCYLRCVIANDKQLAHLQLRSYRPFAQACIYAAKAFIYNEYIIKMGQGELYGGQELGRFKDILEGYADSEELYQTYLTEKLQKILFMNDREAYTRHLKTIIGGYR